VESRHLSYLLSLQLLDQGGTVPPRHDSEWFFFSSHVLSLWLGE
jgi:hypothetical protein